MTTMIDFVRQLNQKSVTTNDQWLDRLRHLDSGTTRKSDLPEIVIVSDPQPDLKPPKSLNAHRKVAAASVRELTSDQPQLTDSPAGSIDVISPTTYEPPTQIETAVRTESETESQALGQSEFEIVDSSALISAHSTIRASVASEESPTSSAKETVDALPIEILDRHNTLPPLNDRFVYDQANKDLKTEQLVNRLVQRFPVVSPASVMFVSVDAQTDCDSVAAKTATCLANRRIGKILLVDGHTRLGELTNYFEKQTHMGLAEAINRNEPFPSLIHELEDRDLDFLPVGKGEMTHRKMDWSRLSRLTIGLNRRYQYSIISGGQVGDLLTDVWSAYVDGVYLLVDFDSADRHHTREAVAHLRNLGSRIIGCVVKQFNT